MSRIPGMAPATRSMMPEAMSRLDTRRRPWSARYSSRASSGVMVRARTEPGGDSCLVVPVVRGGAGRPQHGTGVVERAVLPEGDGQPFPALQLDDQHRKPGAGGQMGQGRHHGRLAYPALAGHDQDPALAEEGADIHDP